MEFYGLLGEKLGHSLSPVIHKKVFEKLNIEAAYKLLPIPKDEIHKVGECIKLLGIKGVNVSIPYKQEIMKQLSYISDEAKDAFNAGIPYMGKLGSASEVEFIDDKSLVPENAVSLVVKGGELFMPLLDLVDKEKELERLNKEKKKLEGEVTRIEKKLSNA